MIFGEDSVPNPNSNPNSGGFAGARGRDRDRTGWDPDPVESRPETRDRMDDRANFFVGWGTLTLINAGLAQGKGRIFSELRATKLAKVTKPNRPP